VEHQKYSYLLIFVFLLVFGCEKADPNPELKDPIYADLVLQLSTTEKDLIEVNKNVDEQKNQLENAAPQSGQAGVFKKRYFGAMNTSDRLNQQIKYWKIRVEERKLSARKSYLESLKNGTAWPDPKEYEVYLSEKKLRQAKVIWDSKERIAESKKSLGNDAKPAEKKEE
jgi:hypothetical protein